ncbi:hypothetical protein BOQ63_001040 (plasmid) [Streptomyces viridifaciens]|nr:hypothetical protein BOQ63_001040 [Streptomyces viridifaciens]
MTDTDQYPPFDQLAVFRVQNLGSSELVTGSCASRGPEYDSYCELDAYLIAVAP